MSTKRRSSAELGFGKHFTDHMVTMDWTPRGWQSPQLRPFENLSLSPAAMVFHYGQAIFEGMKAYRHPDGRVRTFRPELNARRMQASAARLSMPEPPEEQFLECVRLLVDADADEVPTEPGCSLYLRPFMISTEVTLGTRPAEEYRFMVIASPSGAYFSRGYQAITVWVSEDVPRAFPGGTGSAKCAGNYAAGMTVQRRAAVAGADQVLFLDAVEREHLEELGGMNVFVLEEVGGVRTLVTPPLSDTILHGVTRNSVIDLAADLGVAVEERPIALHELRSGAGDGRVLEAFACGTAAVITPIGRVLDSTGGFTIGSGGPGPLSTTLRDALLGIQQGTAADTRGWMRTVV